MTHDPLCVQLYTQVIPIPAEKCIACSVITKVREDMLAKCIAAVETFDDCNEILYILAALRALQEKP
jgi:hypothetical protein